MVAVCFAPIRVPAVRVTALDACGAVSTSVCSSVASTGIITIEQTGEYNERQDFFTLNADGQPCVTDTSPPILKWINLVLTFCKVDPEMFNLMTGEPLVLDDSASPQAIGFRTREGSVNTVNFAFEAWTRISGSNNCSGGTLQFGYFLLPWVIEGTVGDLTLQNGLATFTVNARTRSSALWGSGPYNIRLVLSGADLGEPRPLLTPIAVGDHRHIQLTTLAPPADACGCVDATPAFVIAPGAGAAPLAVVATHPTGLVYPIMIDWGDATATEIDAAGPSTNHSYTVPGSYTATLRQSTISGPTWTSNVVVVS